MTQVAGSDAEALRERFGDAISRFLSKAGKAGHTSGMFDMRRRTLIGVYTFFDHLDWALDVLDAHATPEEIGAAGRGLCGEPFSAQIHGILWGQLLARENELGLGRDGGPPERTERVIEWWARTAGAYRQTGEALVPSEDGDRQPAASAEEVLAAIESFGRPAAEMPEAGATTAALQLYSYVSRGEQRGTTYYHGPYPGPDGTILVVEEFTRMRDNELPWAPPVLPLDTVCSVMELDGTVKPRFDLFQGMTTEPVDYRARLRRTSLLTCDDGAPRPVTDAEREAILAVTASERERIFREQLGWDEEFRMTYGSFHYLDFLDPFFRAANCPEATVEARERFADTVARRTREVADTEPVPVWERLFGRSGSDLFTPLATVGGRDG